MLVCILKGGEQKADGTQGSTRITGGGGEQELQLGSSPGWEKRIILRSTAQPEYVAKLFKPNVAFRPGHVGKLPYEFWIKLGAGIP